MKKQTCKSIDHRCDVQSTYVIVPTSSNTIQTIFLYNFTAPCLQRWSRCIFKQLHPQKRNFCKYMSEREPLRAQYSNVLSVAVKVVSTNCQSSCIPKHSYMHNHASYVFMHSIRLSRYSYASAFSIPMSISIKIDLVNFKFLLLTTNVYCHVNFKIQQSCQHSCRNSSSCSYVNQIQFFFIQFVSVIGQVASSRPRTACTYPFDTRRATSSNPRTARAFYFVSYRPSN